MKRTSPFRMVHSWVQFIFPHFEPGQGSGAIVMVYGSKNVIISYFIFG
ncbi:hypothetical protein [Chitinophaga arvensicola]|nr:hypothetical protein [Chitinophaga arvensicola]